jgi:hypothetical protein
MSDVALCDARLRTLLAQAIIADTMEAGLDILGDRQGPAVPCAAIASAVHDALAAGWVHDPVRLPPGALHCHWNLELTPQGWQIALQPRP